MGRVARDIIATGVQAGARTLDLSGCGLREFPPEVFDFAETLEALDLSGNHLTDLPEDMSRFVRLRRLFCSGNPFERLPPALGACPVLSQVGFRGCGLRELPADALPATIRWLTLTDNRLEQLPANIGERPLLQKLMLAGNRLRFLPETLAGAANLELLRLAANDFDALPPWLADLPSLAWLAFAGNPCEVRTGAAPAATVRWRDLRLGSLLGEGASGRVYAAQLSREGSAPQDVAVKMFKGTMTSDGLPECERAACLAAGAHPNLVAGLGSLIDHPDDGAGLLMPLLPSDWRVLAGPPDAESCSRDVYPDSFRLPLHVAMRIARDVGCAAAHLQACRLMHGDLYAHNTLWDGRTGAARLSDFGAAAFLPPDAAAQLGRLGVRAWALLLGELLAHSAEPPSESVRDVLRMCMVRKPSSRPTMVEALDALASAGC